MTWGVKGQGGRALEAPDGGPAAIPPLGVAVSPPGRGRIRYNATLNIYEQSLSGGPWIPLTGGGITEVQALAAFQAGDATLPATEPASTATRNDHPLIAYALGSIQRALFHGVMPADYSGGQLTTRLDWVAATATSGNVRWEVQFERLNAGGIDIDTNGFATAQLANATAPGVSGVIARASIIFPNAQADGIPPGQASRLRVTRAGGTDTMLGDAQLLRVSIVQ